MSAHGGGSQGQLCDPRRKSAFILFYLRFYPIQDVMGLFFGLSQPQVCAWVQRPPSLTMSTIAPGSTGSY